MIPINEIVPYEFQITASVDLAYFPNGHCVYTSSHHKFRKHELHNYEVTGKSYIEYAILSFGQHLRRELRKLAMLEEIE